MVFPDDLPRQAVELSLIFVAFIRDDQGLDLDKCKQVTALATLFHAVLLQCGDALFLRSAKLFWRASSSCLAMIEGQASDILTQIDRPDRPHQCLATLAHPKFQHLAHHLDDAKSGLHELTAFLKAKEHPQSLIDQAADCWLILDDLSHMLNAPRSPREVG